MYLVVVVLVGVLEGQRAEKGVSPPDVGVPHVDYVLAVLVPADVVLFGQGLAVDADFHPVAK